MIKCVEKVSSTTFSDEVLSLRSQLEGAVADAVAQLDAMKLSE